MKNQRWKCWIMQRLLAPGAYHVWHALANPVEWKYETYLWHLPTGLRFDAGYVEGGWLGQVISCIFGGFSFDCRDFDGGIGHLDRHLVYIRAYRRACACYTKHKFRPKHALFLKMTQLQSK